MSRMPTSGPHDHVHPHVPHGHPGLTRRTVLQGMALGFGAAVTASLVTAQEAVAAGTSVTLPGFSAFASSVKTLKSGQYYLVESSGLPPHNMMVGITS